MTDTQFAMLCSLIITSLGMIIACVLKLKCKYGDNYMKPADLMDTSMKKMPIKDEEKGVTTDDETDSCYSVTTITKHKKKKSVDINGFKFPSTVDKQ